MKNITYVFWLTQGSSEKCNHGWIGMFMIAVFIFNNTSAYLFRPLSNTVITATFLAVLHGALWIQGILSTLWVKYSNSLYC